MNGIFPDTIERLTAWLDAGKGRTMRLSTIDRGLPDDKFHVHLYDMLLPCQYKPKGPGCYNLFGCADTLDDAITLALDREDDPDAK